MSHGIMFHHFYNDKHIKGQGAISAKQLESIIEHCGDKLISADEWYDKAIHGTLQDDICLTFDDALLCQYDIALPVLEKHGLKAFWFVYTSVLNGGIELLEVYRKFRTVYFKDMESFCLEFVNAVYNSEYIVDWVQLAGGYSHDKWKHFPFYSKVDTLFRYIRDTVLGPANYNIIMQTIMDDYDIDIKEFASDLWMDVEHLKDLNNKGHIIGLHSHTHPTMLSDMPLVYQRLEYQDNYNLIYETIGKQPIAMSHPCNSYNQDTLLLLMDLDIEVGFRANMEYNNHHMLEFPREDHAVIIKRIEQ